MTSLVYDIGGLVRVGVTGCPEALAASLERRFGAFTSDAEPDLAFWFGPRPSGALRALGRASVATDDGRTFVLDHLGHSAELPLASVTADVIDVRVEHGFDPAVFVNALLQPLLRLRLAHRSGAALLHASSFGIEAGPVLVCGWSGAGKTGALLQRLRRGSSFYANDWALVAADGTVHPYSHQINLYRRNRGEFPSGASRSKAYIHHSAERSLHWLAGRTAPWTNASRALGVAGRLLGESAAVKTSVATLVRGMTVGEPAPAAGVIDLADDCASPHLVDPDEVVGRVMIGQRYETSAFAGDCMAVAHALGGPVATDELHGVEASVVRGLCEGVPCVRSSARDLDRALALLNA